MRKQNLSFKKIRKQILSINDFIESFFNKLSFFIINIKKFRYRQKIVTTLKNNRVFLAIITIVILTIAYFLIPTAYNKSLIQTKIKNQIFQKYQISVKFNNKINYGLLPKPHFISKNLSIFNNKKKIADVKNLKIFIGFNNFFKINQIEIKDLILNKTDFNIQKNDLNFFLNLLKIEPNRDKVIIKNSNIFFKNKNDEVLFINQIKEGSFYFDFKNLKNVFKSKNKVFNVPYKLQIKNDKLNKEFLTIFNANKLKLKFENVINYNKQNLDGLFKINFKNKNNLLNYQIKKNSLDFSLKDTNKNYEGLVEFKPFYFESNIIYQNLTLKDLFKNPFFIEIIKSQILNNYNLNAKINFNVKKIYDLDRFTDLFLKLKIEEGILNLSDSRITWKESLNMYLEEGLFNYEKNKINFNGRMIINIKDNNDFYNFFQINKKYRKNLKKIELDFNYDLTQKKVTFDNLKINNKSNLKLEKFISNFNSNDEKFFNRITFKSFVNKIFVVYFG